MRRPEKGKDISDLQNLSYHLAQLKEIAIIQNERLSSVLMTSFADLESGRSEIGGFANLHLNRPLIIWARWHSRTPPVMNNER